MTGLRVVRPGDRVADTASGAMRREAAINGELVGARGIWLGHVTLGPGLVSTVHHHGDSESAIYVLSGRARFVGGERLDEVHDVEPGDVVWVPPHEVHVEINRSDTEPAVVLVVRSSQDNVVVNLDPPPGWTPPRD